MEHPLERRLVVKSKRFVHGAVGDVISLWLTDNQLKSLLQSGAVELAPSPSDNQPAPTPDEGEADG